MNKLLTIQDKDRQCIDYLMTDFRIKKIERWKIAAALVAKQSKAINNEFRLLSRLHHG